MATTVAQVLAHKGQQCWTVGADASVEDAVAILAERKIGAVLVCSGNRLLGVLSERDCIRQVIWQKRVAAQTRVADVMIRDLVCVAPTDSVEYCMGLMNDHRIRHLPVVNHGELAVLYCFVFLYFVFAGGGRFSLDGLLQSRRDEPLTYPPSSPPPSRY